MSHQHTDLNPEGRHASKAPTHVDIERAILHTVAYADIFDYPLTVQEVHYYLVNRPATRKEVETALSNGRLVPHRLAFDRGYVRLPGRDDLVETRHRREAVSARMWPKAVRYGEIIAGLPFVRMVALTGALAVRNVGSDTDIDYLIITRAGRLWVCRAAVILLVKLAARRDDVICPNYFLSEHALVLDERNLFTAHEVVQMVPLAGLAVYRHMCQLNGWVRHYLPNADGPLQPRDGVALRRRPVQKVAEALLRTPFGDWLERWEMDRKVTRFRALGERQGETNFGRDWCKGHFDQHGQHTLDAFRERLKALHL